MQEYEAKLEELESALLKQLQTDTAVEKLEEQRKVHVHTLLTHVHSTCIWLYDDILASSPDPTRLFNVIHTEKLSGTWRRGYMMMYMYSAESNSSTCMHHPPSVSHVTVTSISDRSSWPS